MDDKQIKKRYESMNHTHYKKTYDTCSFFFVNLFDMTVFHEIKYPINVLFNIYLSCSMILNCDLVCYLKL